MANKSLTDLTARTSTSDTDLIHVNSGGTDYKQEKADFLKGNFLIEFSNNATLTSQTESLPIGTYFGKINGYGNQTATGLPLNANCLVKVAKYAASNGILDIWPVGNADMQYRIYQSGGTWASSWTKLPQRSEIDSLNSSLPYFGNLNSGTSMTLNVANATRALIYVPSLNATTQGIFTIAVTSTGNVNVQTIHGSGLACASAGLNKITISNSSGVNAYVCAVVNNGSITASS